MSKKYSIYVDPLVYEEFPGVVNHFAAECLSKSSRKTKKHMVYVFATEENARFFFDLLIARFSEEETESEQ